MHQFGLEFAGTTISNTASSSYSDGWTRDSAPLVDNWARSNDAPTYLTDQSGNALTNESGTSITL